MKTLSFKKRPKWEFIFRFHKYWFVKYPRFFKTYSLLEPAWKNKFDSPRCEICPKIEINWLWFTILLSCGDDMYWERWLWIHKWCKGDEQKAIETWPWVGGDEKTSTWFEYENYMRK